MTGTAAKMLPLRRWTPIPPAPVSTSLARLMADVAVGKNIVVLEATEAAYRHGLGRMPASGRFTKFYGSPRFVEDILPPHRIRHALTARFIALQDGNDTSRIFRV